MNSLPDAILLLAERPAVAVFIRHGGGNDFGRFCIVLYKDGALYTTSSPNARADGRVVPIFLCLSLDLLAVPVVLVAIQPDRIQSQL